MTVAEPVGKKPRVARASRQDPAARLRAAAHAWLSGTKRTKGPKKEPRAPREGRQNTASRQGAPVSRLRAASHAWLSAKRTAEPKREPRPPRAGRQAASRKDPAARLRAAAHAWLSAKRARAPKKEPRLPRGGRQAAASRKDPAARLRAAAHSWLSAKRARAPKKEPRAARAPRQDLTARFRGAAWAQLGPQAQRRAAAPGRGAGAAPGLSAVARKHLKGVLEALIFASERPMPSRELSRTANAEHRIVRELLAELVAEYDGRGFRLDEVAGGYVFRTSPAFAPFVREVTDQKPIKMSRAQTETLAIVAYRQPITRPEIDEVRGVDSGAALKSLLERDLVRILGKKDEPGRPMLYGTTAHFLEFFGLKALGELPTLREFTELTEESRRTYERELGEEPPDALVGASGQESFAGGEGVIKTSVTPAELELMDDAGTPSSAPAGGEDGSAGPASHEEGAPPSDADAEIEPESAVRGDAVRIDGARAVEAGTAGADEWGGDEGSREDEAGEDERGRGEGGDGDEGGEEDGDEDAEDDEDEDAEDDDEEEDDEEEDDEEEDDEEEDDEEEDDEDDDDEDDDEDDD